ncbi:hypothetical protein AA0243_1951 [Novacetimonas hansenii NRIC 0243]|nr:hypothetical protein AA0243_1951 [Novacetimonas hansenii NRIC 0243]
MPWCPIEKEDSMGSAGDTTRNFVEMQLHAVSADKREREACSVSIR